MNWISVFIITSGGCKFNRLVMKTVSPSCGIRLFTRPTQSHSMRTSSTNCHAAIPEKKKYFTFNFQNPYMQTKLKFLAIKYYSNAFLKVKN